MSITASVLVVSALTLASPEVSTPVDDAVVLKAAVDNLCRGNYLVIDSKSVQPHRVDRGRLRRFPAAVLNDLQARNRNQELLPLTDVCAGARVASHEEIENAFNVPLPSEPTDLDWRWNGFYKVFPGAACLVRLSVPGRSKRGDTAILYMETGRGSLAGEGSYLLLRKRHGRWVVAGRESVWVA
jgi:hypothetical protein